MPVVARDMQELVSGLLDRLHHMRMTVAGTHGNAGSEVQKAVAVHVPDLDALAVRHDEWIVARVRRRSDQRVALEQCLCFGSRAVAF